MKSTASATYSSQLFKSDQRGSIDSSGYKCFSTFNFGNYAEESRAPFGALQFVNDVSIAPENTVHFNRHESIQDVIIPVSGNLIYKDRRRNKNVVNSESVLFLEPGTDHAIEVQNFQEHQWINYLHIGIKKDQKLQQSQSTVLPISFTEKNAFAPLHFDTVVNHSLGYAGVFNGRAKGNYTLKNENNGVFVYVINGSFEVEDRLMESRDGLSLWGIQQADFKALSENAIILLLEIPLTL